MRKANILIVIPLPPWYIGGVELMAGEICERLKDSFNIRIYCTSYNNRIKTKKNVEEFDWKNITVRIFKGYNYGFSHHLYQDIKKIENIDLIHVHNYSTLIPFLANKAIGDRKIPIVINPHFHIKPSSFLNAFLRKIYDVTLGKQIFHNVKIIICNSYSERLDLLSVFPKIKIPISIIYNGIRKKDIDIAQPYISSHHVILCVSRLEQYKNVQKVIESLPFLPEDYKLVIIGSGSYEKKLFKLITIMRLGNRIEFKGNLTNEEVYCWYKTANVFVHLSEIESFGTTCLEALAAGTPVVSNNDGCGLKEVIDLFPEEIIPVDVRKDGSEAIACAILKAEKIKVFSDLSSFDWDEIAKQFAYIYKSNL